MAKDLIDYPTKKNMLVLKLGLVNQPRLIRILLGQDILMHCLDHCFQQMDRYLLQQLFVEYLLLILV
ncbi:MAG: hypothetical protein EBR82_11755 [Caulobacteraceae bacterium]|nr:hypothetical protein [Caulobacteraceae bacterium]